MNKIKREGFAWTWGCLFAFLFVTTYIILYFFILWHNETTTTHCHVYLKFYNANSVATLGLVGSDTRAVLAQWNGKIILGLKGSRYKIYKRFRLYTEFHTFSHYLLLIFAFGNICIRVFLRWFCDTYLHRNIQIKSDKTKVRQRLYKLFFCCF